jgi:hypothetical protein
MVKHTATTFQVVNFSMLLAVIARGTGKFFVGFLDVTNVGL